MDFEYTGAVVDPFGNQRVGFEGTTTVNRKDWGVSWNAALGQTRRRLVRRLARSRRPAATAHQVREKLLLVRKSRQQPFVGLPFDVFHHRNNGLRTTLVPHPLVEALVRRHGPDGTSAVFGGA